MNPNGQNLHGKNKMKRMGIVYGDFRGPYYSLKFSEIKLRRAC